MTTINTSKRRKLTNALCISTIIFLMGAALNSPAGDYNLTGWPLILRATWILQQLDTMKKQGPVFSAVEVQPEFPGGRDAFMEFLKNNVKYPQQARENKIQGKAFVRFVIDRDGSLTDFKILRDPGYGTGDEALRVLKLSPKWVPGKQNGKTVRVMYTVPINFAMVK